MKLTKKKSNMKYMNNTLIPFIVFILAFSSLGVLFNIQMKENLQKNIKVSLEKDSEILSANMNASFLRYGEVVNQMLTNDTLTSYIKESSSNKIKMSDPKYKDVVDTLGQIKGTDSDINLAWIGVAATNEIVTHESHLSSATDYKITNRPWYLEVTENNNKITYTKPYMDSSSGNMVISIVAPLMNNGGIIGYFGIDINMKKINTYLSSYSIGGDGNILLISSRGDVIFNKDKNLHIKNNINDEKGIFGEFGRKMLAGEKGINKYQDIDKRKYFAYTPIKANSWSVGTINSKSDSRSQTNLTNIMSMLIFGACILILTIVAIIIKMGKNYSELDGLYSSLGTKEKELLASNEEISAAYEQLTASEEELRAQYQEIEENNEIINHLAYHDTLTDLPNRRCFIERFEMEISNNRCGAIILLDIDNFKGINDTLGHLIGDELLKKIAEELKSIEDDKLFISRFGGDEFLILLSEKDNTIEIEQYAEKIMSIFNNRIVIDNDELYTSCSMGITRYPSDSNIISQLIMNADMSMYKVKSVGKNNYMFFDEEMTEKLKEKTIIENLLRKSIKEEQLKILYQPQVDTYTGKIVGYEALIRIANFNISPALFIPLAEEMGMIIEIGRWVTKEAIKQIAIWKQKGLEIKPISINFSAKQLNDLEYYEFLEEQLKEKDIEAKYIDIEITESVFLEKKDETIKFLDKLKALGITISLDDFGTGYSSLSYLTFLPVDRIKLDKSLNDKFLEIENIPVMKSIISLAHSLKLKVVAEGIEDIEQYNRLKEVGCDYIQGYLFSKPLEVEEVGKINNHIFKNLEKN